MLPVNSLESNEMNTDDAPSLRRSAAKSLFLAIVALLIIAPTAGSQAIQLGPSASTQNGSAHRRHRKPGPVHIANSTNNTITSYPLGSYGNVSSPLTNPNLN